MGYKLDPNTGKYTYTSEGGTNTDKTKVIKNDPASTKEEIKGTSDNKTEENASDVFGRGKAKGDFGIRKYSKVRIVGVSKSFEGDYFISEVTHTITPSGYTVDFSIKTKQEDIGKSSSSSSGNDDLTSPSGEAGRKPDSPSSGGGGSSGGGYRLNPETGKYEKIK